MWCICQLAVLTALAAGSQPPPAEWMPARRAAGASPLPHDPDAEIIGSITDPRPALDGNFQVPRGHRLAGVYRNDKPRLPEDYVRFLRRQGLTPEQIEHGAGLRGTRRVRAPEPAGSAPPPAAEPSLSPAPAPGQFPLPGGLTLHLEPLETARRPADLYPAVQTVPVPSIDHLRSAGAAPAARRNEVGVAATTGELDLPKLTELRGGLSELAELRHHHRRINQRLDEQWRRHKGATRGRHRLLDGSDAPRVREEYHVRRLPDGGRSVSYSRRTTHSSSYATRGQSSVRQRQLQRRKRRHHTRRRRQWLHHW